MSPNPYKSPQSDMHSTKPVDDDRPVSWQVLPIITTLLATAFVPIGFALAWVVMHVGEVPIVIPAFFAAALSVVPLRMALRGGVTLEPQTQVLVRWWGIFFPLHSRRIPFTAVKRVSAVVSRWAPEVRDRRYSVAIATDEFQWEVRVGLRGHDRAVRFATALAEEIGCPSIEGVQHEKMKSDVDSTPPASVRLTLFAIAALLLFWVPVVGLIMTALAIYWGHRYTLHFVIALALVPATLGAFVATVLGVVLALIEMGWMF